MMKKLTLLLIIFSMNEPLEAQVYMRTHKNFGVYGQLNTSDFDKNAYGHEVRNALVGRDISKRTSGYAAFTPVIDRFLVEHLFADIFYKLN